MMNRREALLRIGAVVAVGVAPPASALVRLIEPGVDTKAPASDAADERLRKDLAQIESRANSEEGVPMFLACMNLVDNGEPKRASVKPTALSTAVAADFRRTAVAWERIRPKSTADDVAGLIVVLANRDFSQGGMEQSS